MSPALRWAAGVAAGVAGLAAIATAAWLLVPPRSAPPDRLTLTPVAFTALAGWEGDDHAAALRAFLASCGRAAAMPADQAFGRDGRVGTAGAWAAVCRAAEAVLDDGARAFFETAFRPLAVANNRVREGLFTGYYEPDLRGSLTPDGAHRVPLYRRPRDLVRVDLGRFREQWRGERIAGRVVDGALEPYPDRAAIDAGALAGQGLELAWVDDPIAAFFLHIQGSGRVLLPDGAVLRVGYAAQNGQPYLAIGRELIARGALRRDEVSLQSIRAWLAAHPDEAEAVMARNRSYVFFRALTEPGPVGAAAVVLTPGRSLAVDLRYLPLGAPLWLETTLPGATPEAPEQDFRRLMVAQDTGGAIRGPVRGDIFFGNGAEAEAVAGVLKSPGRYYILVPTAAAAALGE